MVKMKKHILYIALGLLALIAIITTVLAIGGVVTLPVIGQPAIQQPAVSDSQPHGPTAAEVEALIDALPQPVTNADSIKVLIARLAYRELSTSQQAQVHNLSLLEAAEQILAELGRKSSESLGWIAASPSPAAQSMPPPAAPNPPASLRAPAPAGSPSTRRAPPTHSILFRRTAPVSTAGWMRMRSI